jgi:hypothetical protein
MAKSLITKGAVDFDSGIGESLKGIGNLGYGTAGFVASREAERLKGIKDTTGSLTGGSRNLNALYTALNTISGGRIPYKAP